jgi:hypothetical protein
MAWCEGCRDHFEARHYDDDGSHRIGDAFGPWGARRAREIAIDALLADLVRFVDCRDLPAGLVDIAARAQALLIR